MAQIAPAVRVALGEEFGLAPGTDSIGKIFAAMRRLGFDEVYDTSVGLVFEKKLYYELENPKIKKITSKKRALELCKDQVTE